MTRFVLSLLFLKTLVFPQEVSIYASYPISAFSIKDFVINDNFWLPKIRVQDITIHYAFDKCNNEGRMEKFLVAGGKKKGTFRDKIPFDDTDLYKIIEGTSYSLISKRNPRSDSYIDSIIVIVTVGKEVDGYITN